MILQSLYALYDRLLAEPDYAVAAPGFSLQKIAFEVVLNRDGTFSFNDLRQREGSRYLSIQRLVPGQAKPSGSGLNPCFLWDNTGYLLGFKPEDPKPERTQEAFLAFRNRHLALESQIQDEGFSAVCRFLTCWDPQNAVCHPELADFSTGFGVFRMQGDTGFVHERPIVREWWLRQQEAGGGDATTGYCLITGQHGPVAVLHEPAIKAVNGAQAGGAKIVSFNCDAFTSYGKAQSVNAPVSTEAAFRYCTALNALLAGPMSARHRITIGDSTVVFWTEKRTQAEGFMAELLAGDISETAAQDEGTLQQVRSLFNALRLGSGALGTLGDDPDTPFYMLGLAPNAARLSVRFWQESTLGGFFDNLKAHYDDIRIVRQWDESNSKRPDHEFPPFWLLLRQTGRESKDIPPLLGGALMRTVLSGPRAPYPTALASAVINRIRADRDINHPRASILKAWLTRLPNHSHFIPMSLDIQKPDPAYRLGRLFAALEKTQEDALGDLNATIRDRFYSSASATPGIVFPRLLKTYQHHLSKLDSRAKGPRERLVQEIMDSINAIPRFLSLENQALFAIGYYHQRKDLFAKRDATAAEKAA